MIAAAAAAKSVVLLLVMMAAQGTLLAIVAVMLGRAGRLRPAWQAAIWLVVIAKFALPWGPAMPWSLSDLIAAFQHTSTSTDAMVAGPISVGVAPSPALGAALGWLVLAAIWAAVSAVVLTRSLAARHAAMRQARRAPSAPDEARALVATLAAIVRVRPPRLVVGDAATGPYVVGVLRPIIVVPPVLLADAALLRAALVHELAHVRRRDGLARFVQLWAGAVFWWLPVVRIASRRLDLAREAACDAWALEASELPRPAYARMLVRMAQLRVAAASPLAAPHVLDARVAVVLGPPARARLGLGHKIGLVAWIALSLGGARAATARPETCKFTPELAEALRLAHPEADRDGDGVVSRDEACEFQTELRRRVDVGEVSTSDEPVASFLAEPLCCNCEQGEVNSPPWVSPHVSCQEGVDR